MQNSRQHSLTTWQQTLANGFKDLEELCAYLNLTLTDLELTRNGNTQFPLRVTRSYAACMEKGNPTDPLLRQILPLPEELSDYPGYTLDPVGDLSAHAADGIIHKYHGRALIIMTGGCAIHCRYCFRRNFPYSEVQLSKSRLNSTLAYINQHTELTEIILSGGDPLLLSDERLADLILQLNTIKHLQRLRIHSRIPIVLPERITPELIDILKLSNQQVILVMHANHANELSEPVTTICQHLHQARIMLLNQSVLLKGVNDSITALCKLSEQLFAVGVVPYYLHMLDKAKGTGHFEVALSVARDLHLNLQTLLPGYLVPKLVFEQAGAAYKIPITY